MKYRKKPVVIEAVRYEPNKVKPLDLVDPHTKTQVPAEVVEADRISKKLGLEGKKLFVFHLIREGGGGLFVRTLEGEMKVNPGAWIIKGIAGEVYPCDDEIFRQTYDRVDDAEEEVPEEKTD